MASEIYGPGGYDPNKPNNNVIATEPAPDDTPIINATAIVSNLESRLVDLQAIIDRPNVTLADNNVATIRQALRDLQVEVRTLARVDRLQTRKLLTLLDGVD